jgi:hypothetical protein
LVLVELLAVMVFWVQVVVILFLIPQLLRQLQDVLLHLAAALAVLALVVQHTH